MIGSVVSFLGHGDLIRGSMYQLQIGNFLVKCLVGEIARFWHGDRHPIYQVGQCGRRWPSRISEVGCEGILHLAPFLNWCTTGHQGSQCLVSVI